MAGLMRDVRTLHGETKKGDPEGRPSNIQQSAPSALSLPRHAKINRALDHTGGRIALQFDIAEFARGAALDAVAQAHELQRTPGLGSSALSNARSGTFVPEAIRHSDATIIRLLRF